MSDPETPKRRSDENTWRRARAPTAVARLVDRLTRPVLGKRGFAAADIIARWPEIVGADLARFALPLQVKFPRGRNAGATLLLRVASSAAASLLTHKAPVIVARVNRFFGYEAVSRIEANHGPLPKAALGQVPPAPAPEIPAAVTALTADIPSADIREALRKLGARLQHRAAARVVSDPEHT
jgi:hypothetical protein